jgi:sugar-specific transcriptional regulator TrmB
MKKSLLFETFGIFGFKQIDIQVYVFLAKTGPHCSGEIGKTLHIKKDQIYRSLKRLNGLEAVYCTLEKPAIFYALPFEQVLDMFTSSKINEAINTQQNKDRLLAKWQSIIDLRNI